MKTKTSARINLVLLIAATVVSLLAQGFWFTPGRMEFLLQYLSAAGHIIPSVIFFLLAILLYITAIRTAVQAKTTPSRMAWTFLAIQPIAVIGIALLLNVTATRASDAGFIFSGLITLLTAYGLYLISQPSISLTASPISAAPDESQTHNADFDASIPALKEQIVILTNNLEAEKQRTNQLILLNELSQQLEAELEPEVAAQLAVNTLERALDCSVVSLFMHEPAKQLYISLASAGNRTNSIPPGYQQDASKGVLGRTTRLKKTQVVNDTRTDPDFILVGSNNPLSIISVPIMQHSQVKSVLEICSDKPFAFNSADTAIAEQVATELWRAWDRASYHQRLTELIQAGISLTTLLDPQAAVQEIALIARKTLEARFVFVTLLDQQGNFSRIASAGDAPRLLTTLEANPTNEPMMKAALNATKPFRIRDLRKYTSSGKLDLDHASLRSALAIPIRLHRLSIGTIIAFGKHEGVFFSENDESLADLLSSQAAASIESSWLYQELRNTLNTTSMLYQLSVDVIQAEELSNAAELIAQAAHKVTSASETGIVLLTRDGSIEAEVEYDSSGFHSRREHPRSTIDQAVQTGQSIIVSAENGSLVCYPLLTRTGTYGALWMNIPESRGQNFANLQTLANQAAIALERSILLSESRKQAKQLEAAYAELAGTYAELEVTYDRTLTALMSALDARDRETEGHSVRVSRLACMLAEKVGLSGAHLKALERGALLHDIGKIGISDIILHKPGKLTEEEWKIMRVHPDIGTRIVERIPFLQEAVPVIRYHHERWDGSGYPLGLKGQEIPVQARIFAIADVFDALTSKRSYRDKSTPEEAVKYMHEQAGILFDPEIVDALKQLPYHELAEVEKLVS